jgi:F-type H+-transporting ATPase subunit epsilon
MGDAMGFRLRILTPDGAPFDGVAESVALPGADGSFGVLEGHAPLLAALRAGVVSVRRAEDTLTFAVGDGAADVGPGTVTVLVEAARSVADASAAEAWINSRRDQLAEPVPSALDSV